jgi:hypothetical protein
MAEEYVESPFGGLLVKIKDDLGGNVGGKIYLIPETALAQFELAAADQTDFANKLNGKLINLDYAIFQPGLIVRGSAG